MNIQYRLTKAYDYDLAQPEVKRLWSTLQVFNIYRLCLALILLSLFVSDVSPLKFGERFGTLYTVAISLYILFSIGCLVVTYHRWIPVAHQAVVQVFTDIILLTLLMGASQETTYVFGILINASIAGGSLIAAGRISLLFASVATIAVLLQHMASSTTAIFTTAGYVQSGILGATFFATAGLAYGLSMRVRTSEALAKKRGGDIAALQNLSEMIIQRMHSGIIVVDGNDIVRLINEGAWYCLGVPIRKGPVCISEVSSELAKQLNQWKKNPNISGQSFRTANAGQGVIAQFAPLSEDKKNSGTLIFLEDTARMAQRAQQMKLASLGRLSASIAHEIRNPLSAISHAGQLLAESPNVSDEDLRFTEIIRKQSKRMNAVIENVLQLSQRKEAAPKVFPLKPWLDSFISDYQQHHDEPINMQCRIEPDDVEVFIDSSQLTQVVTNLCDNGIRYSRENIGEAKLYMDAGICKDSNEPYLEVLDFGVGIDPEIVEHIFEPFYTTKSGGTGLGLYLAKELCEVNYATLLCYPMEQGGTCFRIIFHNPVR